MSAAPRTSPWGAVQKFEELADGVFEVSTAGHGGIMVRKSAADFLSPEAVKSGAFQERSYLCFEEDCCAQLVIRELLDKKLWHIPDHIADKAKYEDAINQSVKHWHPEYWAARQQTAGRKERDTMKDARKDIVFRDENYKEKFRIKDGDSIKITVGYDGEELIRKCRFLDEAHMNVGNGNCYHMDEFMEKQAWAGNTYEPVPGLEPKLDVVIAEPGKPPRDAEIPLSLAALREIIGGEIEFVSKDKFCAVVQGANGNGTVVALGVNGGDLTSLHPYDAQQQKRDLAERIPAAVEKKPTLAERLEAGKLKAAAHNAERQANGEPQKKREAAEH
jgi:hypothetical protein